VENGKFTCAVLVATTMDGWEQAITLRVRQRHDQLLQFATQLLTLVGKERSDEKLLLEALQKLKEVRRSAERFAKASETLERQEQHLVATVLPSLERTVKHLRERFVSEQAEMTLMDAQKADEQELHALCAQAEQLPSCTVLEQQLVERQETLEAASRQSLHQRQRLKDLQDTLENLRHHIAVLGGILGAGS
jgi:ornithine cyclodeaminase/alanine dehydrogenase-like protein (mu-crystallin family)